MAEARTKKQLFVLGLVFFEKMRKKHRVEVPFDYYSSAIQNYSQQKYRSKTTLVLFRVILSRSNGYADARFYSTN